MIGVLRAMGTTLKTALRRPVTERAFPLLLWDHDVDDPFCTGCQA